MPNFVLIWVWSCAYLNCVGWTLSALHQLNAKGYAVALAIWFVALAVWRKKSSESLSPRIRWQKLSRRFRKPFPLAFLILAAMAFLGGAIYAPTNYDALAYRLPRVLHWLAADQWHWIHTIFPRVNNRGCGIEWVSAPLIAVTKSDRLLFLINIVSFLLLPGLIFSVFTRLGVGRRVAWHWMWILPAGYCFLTQAASIGNDMFAAPFALAMVDFALRTRISKSLRDFFASVLAAALLTGVKMPNLPLLLPWAVALLPSLRLLWRRPARTLLVGVVALSASIVPTMFFNAKNYHGDWTGMKPETIGLQKMPALLAPHNVVLCAVQNFTPPIFPFGKSWDRLVQKVMPTWWHQQLMHMMEPTGANLSMPEMQTEENAGVGFGVCLLLLTSIVFAELHRRRRPFVAKAKPREAAWLAAVRLSPYVSLSVMFFESFTGPLGRTIAPYYPLLLPSLLLRPAHQKLVTQHWWRAAAFIAFLAAAGLLLISPARPLFPVEALLAKISGATSPAMARVREVYLVYHERNHAFAPALAALPPDLKMIGMITADDPETSLWYPFGARRIVHVCPQDAAADLKALGVEYVLVKPEVIETRFSVTPGDWLKIMNAQVLQTISLNLRAADGPRDWLLVKLN